MTEAGSGAASKRAIDKAFEERDSISTSDPRRDRARRSRPRSICWTRARCASPNARPTASWTVNQWLKKAVLLSFRLKPMEIIKGGPGDSVWWDKVPSKFDGWGAIDFEKAGFRAVPNGDRTPLGLYRAGRGADAVLRQSRRLCRYRHDGRHLGLRSAPARRSARMCICPAASASAACWSRCRPARPSSRTIASSARGRKWSKAASCARARCSAWACSSASRPRSSTARPARSSTAKCRRIPSSWPATMPG